MDAIFQVFSYFKTQTTILLKQDDTNDNQTIISMTDSLKTAGDYTGKILTTGYHQLQDMNYAYYVGLASLTMATVFQNSVNFIRKSLKTSTIYDDFPCITKNKFRKRLDKKERFEESHTEESFEEEFEELEVICNVCLERLPDRVLIPCGHTYCSVCLSQINTCPNCRSVVNGVMRIYL